MGLSAIHRDNVAEFWHCWVKTSVPRLQFANMCLQNSLARQAPANSLSLSEWAPGARIERPGGCNRQSRAKQHKSIEMQHKSIGYATYSMTALLLHIYLPMYCLTSRGSSETWHLHPAPNQRMYTPHFLTNTIYLQQPSIQHPRHLSVRYAQIVRRAHQGSPTIQQHYISLGLAVTGFRT